jgi:hypothetical protein
VYGFPKFQTIYYSVNMGERKFEMMSIVTSVLALSWGICSCKMSMQFNHPGTKLKLKLMIRSLVDIIPR